MARRSLLTLIFQSCGVYVCTTSTVSATVFFPASWFVCPRCTDLTDELYCTVRERKEASSGSKQARTNSFHLRRASFAVDYRGRYVPSIKHVVYVVVKLDVFVDVFVTPYRV